MRMEQPVEVGGDGGGTAPARLPPGPALARPAWGAAASQLRKRLLLADDDLAVAQDHLDCAELALAGGLADAARTLYELAFLRTGFSAARRRWQADLATATGLWGDQRDDLRNDADAALDRGRFSIDIAVDDLRGLLDLPAGPRGGDVAADPGGRVGAAAPPSPADARGVPALVTSLCALLRRPPDGAVAGRLEAVLDHVRRDLLERPPMRLADHASGPIDDMVAAFAANSLRELLRFGWGLAFAPLGSAALFHAASRVADGGLGCHFRNVQQLIRRGRDVLGLIQLASAGAADAPVARDRLERWSALLSLHLDRSSRIDLVNELGDLGLLDAIAGVLAMAERQPETHRSRDLLWCIRDAALDNGAGSLAARAQALIARRWPDEALEWIILADVAATAGDRRGAAAALVRALRLRPDDAGARERLAELRARLYATYEVHAGYGTPRHRQVIRMRRRAMLARDGAASAPSIGADADAGSAADPIV